MNLCDQLHILFGSRKYVTDQTTTQLLNNRRRQYEHNKYYSVLKTPSLLIISEKVKEEWTWLYQITVLGHNDLQEKVCI